MKLKVSRLQEIINEEVSTYFEGLLTEGRFTQAVDENKGSFENMSLIEKSRCFTALMEQANKHDILNEKVAAQIIEAVYVSGE